MSEDEGDRAREHGTKFEAIKVGMRHTKEGFIFQMSLHPNDTPEALLRDPVGQRYVIVAVRVDDEGTPIPSQVDLSGTVSVRLAGQLCKDERFQVWLMQNNFIDELDEQAAASYVRKLCGITSRSELKVNSLARDRLDSLKDEFGEYLRAGGLIRP